MTNEDRNTPPDEDPVVVVDETTYEPDSTAVEEEPEVEHRSSKGVLAAIAAIALIAFLIVGAIVVQPWQWDNDSIFDGKENVTATPTTSVPAIAALPEGTAVVGSLGEIPMVEGGADIRGDSTALPETPAVSDELRNLCGIAVEWKNLYDCIEGHPDREWYKYNLINKFSAQSGFNWDDVRLWAEKGPKEARFISINNWPGKTDQQARDDVRALIGSDAANTLPIVRHDCIVNTRGLKEHEPSPFADCKRQVRVSLAPLVFENGVMKWRSNAGVFVDCYNLWWLERIVKSTPPPPPPPPTGNGNPPPCKVNCGPPPCRVNCGPPPCTVNCGPPPCTVNCGPPPCTVDCGPPPCTVDCGPPPCTVDCLPPKTPDGPPEAPGHTNVGPPPGPPEVSIPPEPNPMNPTVPTNAPAPSSIQVAPAPNVVTPDTDLNTSAPPISQAPAPEAPADTDVEPVG